MYSQTPQIPWFSLREAVTADDVAITDFKYSNFPAVGSNPETGQNGAIAFSNPYWGDATAAMIACWGAGGDTKTITAYRLYGVTKQNGPIVLLLEGVMTSGPQVCSVHPLTGATLTDNKWVDTITVTGGILSAHVDILDSGNDRICMLRFDKIGIREVFLEYDENASGMTAFNAMITGY